MMNGLCEYCKKEDCLLEDYQNGRIVCTYCGTVCQEHIIADEYEKRTFESDNHEIKRVGPPSRPEEELEPGNYLLIRKDGFTQKRMMYSNQTKINKNCYKIYKLLSSADVRDNLIDITKELYRKLAKNKNMQGRNINHIIIALYYYACRKENMAKSFKDVVKMFPSITERQLKKSFNWVKREIVDYEDENELIKIEKNYVYLYIGDGMEKSDLRRLSYKIIENINKSAVLEGKSPNTIAGLSLILSYKLLNDNSDDFKDFFSTFSTKNTLIKSFEEINNQLEKVIPNEYLNKIKEQKISWV